MSDHQEIYAFCQHWREQEGTKFEVAATGNCTFDAVVLYAARGNSRQFNTCVKIIRNGYEEGKLVLSEQGGLTLDAYHLDFTPGFQDYEYNTESHALIVRGSSPKMSGAYVVTILPQ
jgi:hypothetical protein